MNRKLPALFAALVMLALILWQFTAHPAVSTFSFAKADDGARKEIYLTFDDGPSDRVTPRILDILREEDVCATFFIVGQRAESRKYLIRREFDEGHTVAVHSYSHVYDEIYNSPESLIQDIEKCNKLIHEVTGSYSDVYRFPGGSFMVGKMLKEAVNKSGITYVDWNASFCDAELDSPTEKQLFDAAIKTAQGHNRVVMLAHDSTDRSTTADALRGVIRHFKEKGFVFRKF